MPESLLPVLEVASRLVGQPVSKDRLDGLKKVVAGEGTGSSALDILQKIWRAGRLDGIPHSLPQPLPLHCPFIARHPQMGWLTVLSPGGDNQWVVQYSDGQNQALASLDGCECIALPTRDAHQEKPLKSSQLIWKAIWKYKALFFEALLATFLVNLLTLATSIYSMQVYDRVIPNKGLQTLWVLSIGVGLAILLELLLKHVRGVTLDRTATRIDLELSDWFFQRALGIRMDARPQEVGTLAAQIKGFEMVRSVMSATTLYVLADIPFALLFILIIGAIGGMTALVPLALLPFSLLAGFMFRRRIDRYTLEFQQQGNCKAGLLVESIDSIESIKANSAEWNLQGRWNRLIAEAGMSDLRIRHYTAISQHATVVLNQIGYVGLIAAGAYLVTENQLTMGGLIACAIVSNRALAPIAQLPSILVQLGNAKAATDGLDKLIALPNELDDRGHTLTPDKLDGHLHMERTRFSYPHTQTPAMEVGIMDILPGERVAIIGTIGSGKSTLLKMASGLYRPSEGRVLMGGMDMAQIAPQLLRSQIAYLPQDIHLISGTLRDNLLLGLPDPGDESLLQAAKRTGLMDMISRHPRGLALPITEGGRGISGGQKQLIGITRMVLAKPVLYLLDEPTSSMDAGSEARIVALLNELVSSGATLVVATHKTALLPIVERVMVVQNGLITIDGPKNLVLAKLAGQPQTSKAG